MYIWEQEHWPALNLGQGARLATLLGQVSREQGRLLGRMQGLGFELRREAQLSTLTEDVVRSSEIEGEKARQRQGQIVDSTPPRQWKSAGWCQPTATSRGVVEMMLDATTNYAQTFKPPTGYSAGMRHSSPRAGADFIKSPSANWRNDSGGPMQVVSGPIGRPESALRSATRRRASVKK